MTYDQVIKLANLDDELKQSKKIHWINDLDKTDPWISFFYHNDKCYVNIDGTGIKEVKDESASGILQLCKQDSTLYFELPPSKELADAIREKLKSNGNISLVNKESDANYILFGTISKEGKPSYGLRRTQTSARDSLASMPLQTENFVLENNNADSHTAIADKVYEYAMRLFKVRAWLQLTGPQKNKNDFPFHLELVN